LLVILLHVPLGYVLLHGVRSPVALTAVEHGIAVAFVPRTIPMRHVASPATAPPTQSVIVRDAATPLVKSHLPAATSHASAPETTTASTRLDLSLPDTYRAQIDRTPHRIGDTRNPVDFQPTRFNPQWTPDGGEMQQAWAFRSKTARMLLSMTGALVKPCTEAERRRREQRCAGAQYEGD